jgi:hypothetical protein
VRSRQERIARVTKNIRQYYTLDPQTDGILDLVQDEGETMLICHLFVDMWCSIVLCLL